MNFLRNTLLVCLVFIFSVNAASISPELDIEPGLDEILAGDPAFAGQEPGAKQSAQVVAGGSSDQPEVATQEIVRLDAIAQELDSIFNDHLFLNQAVSLNQVELYKLKLFVDNEIEKVIRIREKSSQFTSAADWYEQRLSDVIYWFKFACLNLEVLTVCYDESKKSMLDESLDFVEMQQAKFTVLSELIRIYSPWTTKGVIPVGWTEFTEKLVRKIIFRSLPERLQHSIWSYVLFGATQSSSQAYYLSKILSQDFYGQNLVLAEQYLEVSSTFYKTQKFGHALDAALLYGKVDKLICAFAATRVLRTSASSIVLELLLSKLIKIKNDVAKFYKPAMAFMDNHEKAKLLVRYRLLLEDKKIELFCSDKQFYAFFDLYCSVLQIFFEDTVQTQNTAVNLFELECELEKLMNDKQASLWKKILCKKDQSVAVLDEISKLLNAVSAQVNKELQAKEQGFLSKIFSGNWIDTGKFKNMGVGGTGTFVEFMEYLFNRKFDDFKQAAFFLLARTSPVLAAGLIYKIVPYLSGDLQSKVSGIIGGNEQDSGSDNKIFDFISKNPEIFNKLCEVKPELVNGLANVVEQKLGEARA